MSDEPHAPETQVIPYTPNAVAMPLGEIAEHPHPINHACPNLSAAIALAREKCRIASKDKKNEFHKYSYASADEVINTAKEALIGSGLAIIPQLQEMTVVGAGNMAFHALNRTIFLSHSSGEFVPLTVRGWPVVVERGKTLDKAFATALTGSMAYLLRDLLQMPRGDDHDMNHRDDRPQQQATKTDPKEVVRQLAKAIEESESMDDLRAAFNDAMKNKAITTADKQALNKLKEEAKARMQPEKTPDPTPAPTAAKTTTDATAAKPSSGQEIATTRVSSETPYQFHAKAIQNAAKLQDVETAYANMFADKSLTKSEKARLATLAEDCRGSLQPASDVIGQASEERKRLAATK